MSKSVLVTSRSFGKVCEGPVNLLNQNGFAVDFLDYKEEEFASRIANYDALIIGAHDFSVQTMHKAKKLKIICKHGTGLDNINLEAAKSLNIRVTNAPAANSNAVADLAFGLMLDIARKISYGAKRVKEGYWERLIGTDVCFKTLGLIGFGAIAKNVAKRAQGFGMKVLAFDPYIEKAAEEYSYVELTSFEEILKQADFLSFHIPLNNKTRNLVDKEQLALMKKGSFIINTSRGGIVNEQALYQALKDGHLAGAGLDVTEKEPPSGSPLLTLDNVSVVPHIASYSKEALNKISEVCAKNVVNIFKNEPLENLIV